MACTKSISLPVILIHTPSALMLVSSPIASSTTGLPSEFSQLTTGLSEQSKL